MEVLVYFYFQNKTMQVEANTVVEALIDEPMFGILDIILLIALIGIGGWWLLKDKKKAEASQPKSYTMQLVV